MSSTVDQLNQIAARWHHGHHELTAGCALCRSEFAEVWQLLRGQPDTTTEEAQP